MSVLSVVKFVVGASASIGTGMIISDAVRMVTPINQGIAKKIFVTIGSGAIAGLVGKAVEVYVGELIDETVQLFKPSEGVGVETVIEMPIDKAKNTIFVKETTESE